MHNIIYEVSFENIVRLLDQMKLLSIFNDIVSEHVVCLWILFGICKGNTLRLVNECVSRNFVVIHYSNCYLAKYRCFKKNMEEDVENWTKVLEIQKIFPLYACF